MPVSVCSAYQRYLRMLLPIKCHPLDPIPRARLWCVGNPHTQSGGFHHGSWGLVPSRYTNSPPRNIRQATWGQCCRRGVLSKAGPDGLGALCRSPTSRGWPCMDDDWWKGKAAVGVSNVSISQKGQLDEGKYINTYARSRYAGEYGCMSVR